MKNLLRPIVCAGALAALMCVPSFAAEPDAVPLLVNGEEAVFPDAVPVFRGDTIDVPAAAALEALGYEVAWDEPSQTITAEKGEDAITLTLGSTSASGGAVTLTKAPYVDPATWRTYIAAEDLDGLLPENFRTAVDYGFVVDSAGSLVMSGAEMAVIVDDVDAIWEENTETYALMDQYMDYAGQYKVGNWQLDGSYLLTIPSEGAVTPADGSQEYPAEITNTVGGDYSVITNQTAMQLAMGMSIGGTIMGEPIFPVDMDLDLRADLESGMLYLWFQSEDLEQLLSNVEVNGETSGFQIPDQWYSMDMKEIYDMAYGPGVYNEIVALSLESADASFSQTLRDLLSSDMISLSPEFTTRDYLALFNSMFADSSFEKTGSTYTSTPIDLTEDGVSVQMWVELFTSGGQINGYGVEMTMAAEDGSVLLTAEMRENEMTMAFDMDMPGAVISFTLDGAYRPAAGAPATEPPAGAEVVDIMESLLGTGELTPEPESSPAA